MHILFAYKYILLNDQLETSPDKKFTETLSGWTSRDVKYDKSILDVLDPDITIFKQYQDKTHIPVTMFIAYYNSAEKSDLSHSPIVCFTGQGWEIISSSQKSIPVGILDETILNINRIEQKYLDTYMVSYHWYQTAHSSFRSRGAQKISLLIDKLTEKKENNAFIRLTIQGSSKIDVENAENLLERFIKDFYPTLKDFLSLQMQ